MAGGPWRPKGALDPPEGDPWRLDSSRRDAIHRLGPGVAHEPQCLFLKLGKVSLRRPKGAKGPPLGDQTELSRLLKKHGLCGVLYQTRGLDARQIVAASQLFGQSIARDAKKGRLEGLGLLGLFCMGWGGGDSTVQRNAEGVAGDGGAQPPPQCIALQCNATPCEACPQGPAPPLHCLQCTGPVSPSMIPLDGRRPLALGGLRPPIPKGRLGSPRGGPLAVVEFQGGAEPPPRVPLWGIIASNELHRLGPGVAHEPPEGDPGLWGGYAPPSPLGALEKP